MVEYGIAPVRYNTHKKIMVTTSLEKAEYLADAAGGAITQYIPIYGSGKKATLKAITARRGANVFLDKKVKNPKKQLGIESKVVKRSPGTEVHKLTKSIDWLAA